MRAGRSGRVYDLSGIFNGESRTMFVDRVHVLEAGNERVAEAMVQALRGVEGQAWSWRDASRW